MRRTTRADNGKQSKTNKQNGNRKGIIKPNSKAAAGSANKPNQSANDMADCEYEKAKVDFLKGLKLTMKEKKQLEDATIFQSENPLWLHIRNKLLTASWFSRVCKRRQSTNCVSLVKDILYGNDLSNVPSIKHGVTNESTALGDLEKILKVKITKTGLYLDKQFPFLGAVPDGKCKLGIVEIKCPSSAYSIDPEEAIIQKKIDFWKHDSGTFIVNKSNKWYYQIQGQLRITGMDTCIFAVWTGPGKIKYEAISKDEQFWKENMEARLIEFYEKCLLPELVDSRKKRKTELRSHSSHK